MPLNEGWGKRVRAAKRAYEQRHDVELTLDELGVRVAVIEGRETPYRHPSVSAWLKGQEPGSFALTRAIAVALEVDPRDLVWPEGEGVVPRVIETIRVRAITPEETERARKVSERDAEKAKPKKKAARRRRPGGAA